MNASAAPSDLDAAEAAMVEEHCVMLKRLADIGMALVEKLAADVEAGAGKGDPAASFEKLAQAVRRTLAIDQTVRLICKEMGMDSDAYVGGPDNPNSVPAAILNSG